MRGSAPRFLARTSLMGIEVYSGSCGGHVLEGGGEGAAGGEFRNRGQGGGALFVR